MQTPSWVNQLFQSIDAMDTEKFLEFLADNAQFKFGNSPAAIGRDAIRAAVSGFFTTIKGLRHNLLNTWVHPDTVICQGEVTYTRHDGSQICLPFLNVFGMKGDRIKDYLIYMDINPLYSPQK